MGFWEKLTKFLRSPSGNERYYNLQVRCNRCGEVIKSRVDLFNELSMEFENDQSYYVCRKVLMGGELCFQKIEVWLKFDKNRQLQDRKISGGTFVDAA